MKKATLALLFPAILALPAFAQDVSDEGDLITGLEARYLIAKRAADRVTVTIMVVREKEVVKKKPTRRPRRRFNLPMRSGGVFSKRPYNMTTSGTILDANGFILTTAFNVIGGKVKSITVTLPGGADHVAKLVGFNELYDLALLKIEAEGLPTLKGANLNNLRVGSFVVAAGRAPNGYSLTLNPGIISAPGRHGGRTTQIDCRVNYGSVGGPVIDRHGHLVGITCRIRTQEAATIGQNSGVAFVIRHDQIGKILPDLKTGMRVEEAKGAFLGIQGRDWDDGDGVEILQVLGGTSAEKYGMQAGDIITEFDGKKVGGMEQLRDRILRHKVGDKVKIKILRNGKEQIIQAKLGERAGN